MQFSQLTEEEQNRLLKSLWDMGQEYLKLYYLNSSERDEALQEALITVWRRYETLKDPEKYLPWARSILKNKIRKLFRRKKRERQWFVSLNQLAGEQAAEGKEISEKLVYEEMERFEDSDLYGLVMNLGCPASTILRLHYQYGETYEEIAHTLSMKPATVRSIAHRSREKLKKAILRDTEKKEERADGKEL